MGPPPTPIIVASATPSATSVGSEATTTPVSSTPITLVTIPVSATLKLDLGNGLMLYSVPAVQNSSTPTYTITSETPLLAGVDSPAVTAFNQAAAALVAEQVAGFVVGVQGLNQQFTEFGSSFALSYEVTASSPTWLSLRFSGAGYVDGAAHPYHYTITLTYDLAANRALALADLFLPGSAYLERVASAAIQRLQERAEFMFPEGANPSPENYRNWNITPEGLLITFDEYQVAPYAAGSQLVVIPYSELADMINPAGPLMQ